MFTLLCSADGRIIADMSTSSQRMAAVIRRARVEQDARKSDITGAPSTNVAIPSAAPSVEPLSPRPSAPPTTQ